MYLDFNFDYVKLLLIQAPSFVFFKTRRSFIGCRYNLQKNALTLQKSSVTVSQSSACILPLGVLNMGNMFSLPKTK